MQLDFSRVLRFYRELALQTFPALKSSEWALTEGVYWFPFTPSLGLCATSDGQKITIELVRGLSGDQVRLIEHPFQRVFDAKAATTFVKDSVTEVLADLEKILGLFEIPTPTSVRVSYQPNNVPAGVVGWSLSSNVPKEVTLLPNQFFLTREEFVSDPKIFIYGGLTVFLYREQKEARLLVEQLIVGNELRSAKLENPLYIVEEGFKEDLILRMRSSDLKIHSVDRVRFRSASNQAPLGVFDQDHQLVLTYLDDLIGTSLCTSHYLEMCGENTDERNPLYHLMLIQIPEDLPAADAVKMLENLGAESFGQVGHIHEVEKGCIRPLYSDPRMSPQKIQKTPVVIPYL